MTSTSPIVTNGVTSNGNNKPEKEIAASKGNNLNEQEIAAPNGNKQSEEEMRWVQWRI